MTVSKSLVNDAIKNLDDIREHKFNKNRQSAVDISGFLIVLTVGLVQAIENRRPLSDYISIWSNNDPEFFGYLRDSEFLSEIVDQLEKATQKNVEKDSSESSSSEDAEV